MEVVKMKVQISLDDELFVRIDKLAKKNYMSRSGLISQACISYLITNEVVYAVKDIALSMRKIADTGEVDIETRIQLEDFERIAKMISGGLV